MTNWLGLVICLVVCYAASGIGAIFTTRTIRTWYATIRKPTWNPPNWIFAPVWTMLYTLMAVAWWLAIRAAAGTGAEVLVNLVFLVQLALNVLWSYVFFGRKMPAAAAVEVLILWVAILVTILVFAGVNATASWLLVPYLAWVSFAATLNLTISKLNPTASGSIQ